MIDQLIIGDKASYDDFEANVKEREIQKPKKKSIKKSVAFSNAIYDFTKINGEVYWEERELEYVFEITADTPEELEEKKIPFCSWLMNVHEEKLFDPFIRDYHFIATFDDIDIDDSEIEKATITATFTAYPYMIANKPKVYEKTVSSNLTFSVLNDSSHRLIPTIKLSGNARIIYENTSVSLAAGTHESELFMLPVGESVFYIENQSEDEITVSVSFIEEVL